MFSFWERESFLSGIDIAIIGSGIVGLSAALHLRTQLPQARIAVFERGALPSGASTKNAGFACFGSISELLADLETQPESAVWGLVERRFRGLQRLRARLGDADIDYHNGGNYELFFDADTKLYERCMSVLPEFNQRMAETVGVADAFQSTDARLADFRFGAGVQHLIWNRAEGQIHTGKMMRGLLRLAKAADIEIFNGLHIDRIEETERAAELILAGGAGKIEAKQVLVATNGFARQLLPHLEVEPGRNQVIITEPIAGLRLNGCFHYDEGYVYFRNVGERILLGGGRNKARAQETTTELATTEFIQDYLENILYQHIVPNHRPKIELRWSGILGLGSEKRPIVERLSERVCVSVRMGGMGVAIGSLVGEEGAALVAAGLV